MSTFESLRLTKADTFWNGNDLSGGMLNGNAFFSNSFDTTWKSWSGFAASNVKDVTTKGFGNQYACFPGFGANYTSTYAVMYSRGTVKMTSPTIVSGFYVTNATFSALSMRDGDQYAKKFGGSDGSEKDFFGLVINGYGAKGNSRDTVYLADFRTPDKYILDHWKYIELDWMGQLDSIEFSFVSSDTGQFGINTPQYACFDNFNAPKPVTSAMWPNEANFDQYALGRDKFANGMDADGGFLFDNSYFVNDYNPSWDSWTGWAVSSITDTATRGFANQYSAIPGMGAKGSSNYMVGYKQASVLLRHDSTEFPNIQDIYGGAYVANSTYAYHAMKDGSQFNKKFGGDSGNDPDFLVLKVSGVDFHGNSLDTLVHYLADFRFTDKSKDYISASWDSITLSSLLSDRNAVRLDFWIEGSDTGQYGLNTPAYFCLDDFFKGMTSSIKKPSAAKWNIYPNPASERLYIDSEQPIQALSVYNLMGEEVKVRKLGLKSYDVSHLNTGNYVVRVQFIDWSTTSRKLVVK